MPIHSSVISCPSKTKFILYRCQNIREDYIPDLKYIAQVISKIQVFKKLLIFFFFSVFLSFFAYLQTNAIEHKCIIGLPSDLSPVKRDVGCQIWFKYKENWLNYK